MPGDEARQEFQRISPPNRGRLSHGIKGVEFFGTPGH